MSKGRGKLGIQSENIFTVNGGGEGSCFFMMIFTFSYFLYVLFD